MDVSGGGGESGGTSFDYFKRAGLNSDRSVNVSLKDKENQELITEQQKMRSDVWCGKPLHRQHPSRTDKKGVGCWR